MRRTPSSSLTPPRRLIVYSWMRKAGGGGRDHEHTLGAQHQRARVRLNTHSIIWQISGQTIQRLFRHHNPTMSSQLFLFLLHIPRPGLFPSNPPLAEPNKDWVSSFIQGGRKEVCEFWESSLQDIQPVRPDFSSRGQCLPDRNPYFFFLQNQVSPNQLLLNIRMLSST